MILYMINMYKIMHGVEGLYRVLLTDTRFRGSVTLIGSRFTTTDNSSSHHTQFTYGTLSQDGAPGCLEKNRFMEEEKEFI